MPPARTRPAMLYGHFVGLAIVAVVPTAFWTAVLFAVLRASVSPLSLWTLGVVAGTIFTFLIFIWASCAVSRRQSSDNVLK